MSAYPSQIEMSSGPSSRRKRIEELFQAAMAQDEASRGAFLRTACTSDDELRQELESLVALECTAEGFMDALALHMVARRMADDQGLRSWASRLATTGYFHGWAPVGWPKSIWPKMFVSIGRSP